MPIAYVHESFALSKPDAANLLLIAQVEFYLYVALIAGCSISGLCFIYLVYKLLCAPEEKEPNMYGEPFLDFVADDKPVNADSA